MNTWLCICDNDVIFHFTGRDIIGNNEMSELEYYVNLDNYKKIKLLKISSENTLQYILNEDATNFVKCGTTDILSNIWMPNINKKLFPQEDVQKRYKLSLEQDKTNTYALNIKLQDTKTDKSHQVATYNQTSEKIELTADPTKKEYNFIVSFNDEPNKPMTFNEIGEYIQSTNDYSIKIYNPITNKTYFHNEELNKFTEWSNNKDTLPLEKYMICKFKMIMYYPKDFKKPFELHTIEIAEKEVSCNSYNVLKDTFNKYCLDVEKEVEEFIKKNNITQLQQVLIIRNDKICGKFNHQGYFYGDRLFAYLENLKPVYQKICNMCIKRYVRCALTI